jgi:hypothetical protein
MKKLTSLFVAILVALMANACAPEEMERYTEPVSGIEVEECHVHMVFNYSYYEGEGYVWDVLKARNGQDESVKLLITYVDTDAVALEKSLGHLSDREFDIFINKGSDIVIRVMFQDVDNNWVDCPASPTYVGL